MISKDEESNKFTSSVNLKLEEEESIHTRHLTIHSNHLLAIGGEDGIISAVPLPIQPESQPRIIKRYDEPVKALAFSGDGERVAVGYEDGFVDIYTYSQDEVHNSDADVHETMHPFISKSKKVQGSDDDHVNDGDLEGDFFTQSSQFDEDDNATGSNDRTFRLKHRFEASIRHLQFQPYQGDKKQTKYYLAIAAEASPGFMIVDVTSEDSSSMKYLDDEANVAYKQGGVRSLSYSPNGDILMTLGMDGRACFWSTKGGVDADPKLDWELIHEEVTKVVDKVDTGAFADVGDKSLYPVWNLDGNILGIPGCADLMFRKKKDIDDVGTDWLKENRMVLNLAAKKGEEGSSIVGLAFDPSNDGYVVASTRDGRIGLWKINNDRKEDDPEGKFVKEIYSTKSMCTHIVWHKDKHTNDESLCLALQNGFMFSIHGRCNFIPKQELTASAKTTKQDVGKEIHLSEQGNQRSKDLVTNEAQLSELSTTQKSRLKKQSLKEDQTDDDDDTSAIFDSMDNAKADFISQSKQFVEDEAEENVHHHDDDNDDNGDIQFDDVTIQEKEIDSAPNNATMTTQPPRESGDNGDVVNDLDMNEPDVNDYTDNDERIHDASMPKTMDLVNLIKPQPPFAPSATPQASRTILCWNHIGVITTREEEEYKSIDISFTDAMANRPISFTDNMQFILGSLGEDGAIFATDLVDDINDGIDDDIRDEIDNLNDFSEATKTVMKQSERRRGRGERSTGSCVYFHRFESFGPVKNKDWFVTLPEGEKVLGCATGQGWNAIVTSRRFLRSFTSGGVQGPIVWLRGEPVTIVGRGRFLAVFYHDGNPLMDETQKLGYSLYDGVTMREIASDSVSAISSKSFLTWAGFSNDFSLSIMDNDGMLSMLMTMKPDEEAGDKPSFSWAPMLDTVGLRKSREDSFWPVTVLNGKLICIPLKGVAYPNPARRPLTTSLQLRIPLARDGNDKSYVMEEVAVRANMALEHKNFLNHYESNYGLADSENLETQYEEICAQVDKITLKLLFRKIEGAKLEAALDLVHRLHLEQSFEIAMDVADRSRHRKLSDKIYSIMEAKFKANEEEDDFSDAGESYRDGFTTYSQNQDFEKRGVNVSPEVTESRQKRKPQDDYSEKPKSRKRINPFATNAKKSPGKPLVIPSPAPKKPTLSRMSTFSAESRRVSKAPKEIL